jgi:sulfur-oxidizing protein SoxX
MKARFPDREKLRQQIWDSRGNDPHTLMPPFGKFRILTDQEIERIIDYLYTL